MAHFKFLTAFLIAGSVLATPTMAQERKSLFQVLFPKAYEKQVQRNRTRRQELLATQLPKVKTSRNHVYRVAEYTQISIKPEAVKFAAVKDEDGRVPIAAPQPGLMAKYLDRATEYSVRAEAHLSKAISDYYSVNQKFHWINEQGEWNARARSVMKILQQAGEYGLRADDYRVDVTAPESSAETDLAIYRLQRELSFSVAVMRYAMDAEFGTINPNRLSGYHDFPVHDARTPEILEKIFGTSLPARVLTEFHPANTAFEALKHELTQLQTASNDVIELPQKILIKPGMRHEDLPKFIDAISQRASDTLKNEHEKTLSNYLQELVYSEELVALVKAYQKEAGLRADGVIGRNTSTSLAGRSSADRIDTVKLAMERLRWLPNELGERHVFINQPEYRARYIEAGEENLSMRVIVGKKSNQTNFFYDEIEHVEYNPYWGVPRSIIVNEFLPKSISNPGYLDQQGYEVTTFGGKRISASSINWAEVGTHPKFAVRQPPGTKNALGELKIMFPNSHSIYMHDTPAKSLFNRDTRAFSHGCVRLHDPQAMAAAVLGKSRAHIKASIAQGKNQKEHLSTRIPVYVSYFTAWPQADGSIHYFADMYGRDAHLKKAIEATREARNGSIRG